MLKRLLDEFIDMSETILNQHYSADFGSLRF